MQKAKNFPIIVNFFLIATPEVWIVYIFGVGYVTGFVLYIFVQFDLKYKHRNQRDWHYTTWLIALPAVIAINQRFQPKCYSLRLFYGFILLLAMPAWQIFFFFGIRFIKVPFPRPQISSIAEIIEDEFRLVGSPEVQRLISFDDRVFLNRI